MLYNTFPLKFPSLPAVDMPVNKIQNEL